MYAYAEDRLHPSIVFTLWPFIVDTERTLRDKPKAFSRGSFVLRTALSNWYVPEAYERIYSIMPRAKKGTKHDTEKPVRKAVVWHNIPLTDDDDLHILDRWPDGADVLSDMVTLLGEGYSFSIKPDDRGNGYVCFCTGEYVQSDGEGVGVTGRSSDPLDACRTALYRLTILLSPEYTPAQPTQARRFR